VAAHRRPRLAPRSASSTFSSPDELYDAVRSINWSDWMTPDHTLAVDCNVRDSALTHSQYAARRVKDGICDQFASASGGGRAWTPNSR
jgi:23S rRNA G2445 N2-methylase RlmL